MGHKKTKKTLNPGDILEMIVEAQSRPADELDETAQAEEQGVLTPIISIHGKDVEWHELEFKPRKKDRAA